MNLKFKIKKKVKPMKRIDLKKETEVISINGKDTEVPINTIDLLKICINTPIEGGYNIADLSLRLKLLDKIQSPQDDFIDFEDQEFSGLSNIIKSAKWNILSKKVLEFIQLFN